MPRFLTGFAKVIILWKAICAIRGSLRDVQDCGTKILTRESGFCGGWRRFAVLLGSQSGCYIVKLFDLHSCFIG
jgi:hypothetical protein